MLGQRECLECSQHFQIKRYCQRFCGPACRSAFHRRRERRGAELYDLLMIYRFDRAGEGPEAMKLLSRYAGQFREEDKAERRPRSWLTLKELESQLAQLRSTRVA
jgi:hypothetical protein